MLLSHAIDLTGFGVGLIVFGLGLDLGLALSGLDLDLGLSGLTMFWSH